ncbi:Mitochondrial tRNAs modification protein [Coemansia guatemalensis]|uniref:N(6)-L-threonylcarbamoyladenine synthase n=1 Tax=Coemansia guatemalensis TaxID=2761395 RepID=A0A9W8LSQ5_9FUNG|nr:Mitochondrial tRNAs modification protein [Coemansia guatemalensis]
MLTRRPLIRALGRRRISTASEQRRPVRVLGLETSCDDTAAAIVTGDGNILAETNVHQHKVHEEHGGIVPLLAADRHLQKIPLVVRETLEKAEMRMEDVDAVAVTRGPGLPASLVVGLAAGKTLAAVHAKPLIGVHHMEAHALMARMGAEQKVQFPYLCLLISGGHTLSLVVHDVNHHSLIGQTRDESIGVAFDKVAREIELPWIDAQVGGGPGAALEQMAREGNAARFPMPMPMNQSTTARDPGFSFSGIMSHVARMREQRAFDHTCRQDQADLAAAFQQTAAKHLQKKAALALAHAADALNTRVTCMVASGGVASNQAVRQSLSALARRHSLPLICPPPRLCTDNGVMIAWAGIERLRRGLLDPYDVDFIQRWPLDQLKQMPYVPRESSF